MRWLAVTLALLAPSTAVADVGVARREYNRLWNHYVAPRLGVTGKPAPPMQFSKLTLPGASAETEIGAGFPVGGRPVFLSHLTRKALKNPKIRNWGQRDSAHEMRHAYQPEELLSQGQELPHDQQPAEIDAIQFARSVMRGVKKDHRFRRKYDLGGYGPVANRQQAKRQAIKRSKKPLAQKPPKP